MTTFLDRQRGKRHSPIAILAKFERTKGRVPNALFTAFEALLDKAVYIEDIKQHIKAPKYVVLLCDGKRGVTHFFDHVQTKYGDLKNVLCFIDRDFDEILGYKIPNDPKVYITDGYSIENRFSNREALRVVLEDILHVEDDEGILIDGYLHEFDSANKTFSRQLMPLMAWTIAIREMGCRVHLGGINLQTIFSIDAKGCPRRRAESLKTFIVQSDPNASLLVLQEIRRIITKLKALDPDQFVRGKFAIWFFLKFIAYIKAELRDAQIAGERALFLDAAIDAQNIVQLLVGRLATPDSLVTFLREASRRYTTV